MHDTKALYALVPLLGIGVVLGGVTIASAQGFQAHGFGPKGDPTTFFQNEATLLGVSVDEVKNAWAEGKGLQALAKEKGISQATLQANIKKEADARMKEQLASLVSSGKLTQAQADEILTNRAKHATDEKTTLATALGITVSELESYQNAGKGVQDIITEKGLNKETVMTSLRDARLAQETKDIETLVSKGVLTQDQANKRIETLKNKKGDMPLMGRKMPRGRAPGFSFRLKN